MYIVVLFLFIPSAYAQLDLEKSCNFTNLITNYTVTAIAGSWYQLERIQNTFETGDCSTDTFTATLANGMPTALDFSYKEVVGGKVVHRNANVTLSKSDLGVLNFTFSDGDSYDYLIIPVIPYEYESVVLYSCQNNGNRSSVWAWKLGKYLTQSPEAKNATERVIAGIEDIANATWRTNSFSEAACKTNGGEKRHITAAACIFILLGALALK